MSNPAASPTVSSTVGLKNMVIAELTTDTEETLTYGDLHMPLFPVAAGDLCPARPRVCPP